MQTSDGATRERVKNPPIAQTLEGAAGDARPPRGTLAVGIPKALGELPATGKTTPSDKIDDLPVLVGEMA